MKEKVEISPTLNNLMDDDFRVILEVFFLISNIKKEVMCCVLHYFLSI